MAVNHPIAQVRVRRAASERRRPSHLRAGEPVDFDTLICTLTWGIGDVLLSTSALREFRRLNPGVRVIYRTYAKGGPRRLAYALGAPSQVLEHNADVDDVVDVTVPVGEPVRKGLLTKTAESRVRHADFHYADFGGPSLDYPIQAHYWENLGLAWTPGQRFDAVYHVTPAEREFARKAIGEGPHLVMTPGGGWPGKSWSAGGWLSVQRWALNNGIRPIVLAGEQINGPGWHARGVLNLSGRTDIREAAAILAEASHALMTEGGPSNLRFAVGRPVTLLTCATQVNVQVWTPPELTTEVRMRDEDGWPACEPCLWRRDHVLRNDPSYPPASVRKCPSRVSLRDIRADDVISILEQSMSSGAASASGKENHP